MCNKVKMEEYVTVSELSIKLNRNKRILQKRIKKLLQGNPKYNGNLIIFQNKKYYLHTSIIYEFEPVYKTSILNPDEVKINEIEWDIFGDFVPDDATSLKALIEIMENIFEFIKKHSDVEIKLFFVVENQPKAGNHVHYFIKSDSWFLNKLLKNRIDILSLCNQYRKPFKNEIVSYATSYLNKGGGINYKGATLLHSELITAKKRK